MERMPGVCPVGAVASKRTAACRSASPAWTVGSSTAPRRATAPPPATRCVETACPGGCCALLPPPAKPFSLLLGTKTHTCVFALFFRYYRKTKLSGFQDMECVPCGDPPPPYEPHCKHPALLSSHQWSFSSSVAMTRGSANMATVARSSSLRAVCVCV